MNKFFSCILMCVALVSIPLTEAIAAPAEGNTPEPLAKVGSHWNYWYGRERTYGFRKYEVTAHETIKAAVDRNGNGKKDTDEVEEEILAAKIEMWRYEAWQNMAAPEQRLKRRGLFMFLEKETSPMFFGMSIFLQEICRESSGSNGSIWMPNQEIPG